MKIALFALLPAGLAVATLSPFLRQTPAPPASAAIMTMSGQRILAESADGRAGLTRLQALQQARAGDLRSQQQKVDTLHQEVLAADPASRTSLQGQEQQERAALERMTVQAQSDIQALQRQINTDLMGKVRGILDDLLKDQPSVQMVLSSETAVMWSRTNVDVTDRVLARLNGPATVSSPPVPAVPVR
jgi:Skp family chaperone for outer membrane proteins